MKIFRLKEIHFITLIISFTVILCFVGNQQRQGYRSVADNIPEIEETFFTDSLNKKAFCFVLFYSDGLDICNEMRSTMERFRTNTDNIPIYKINADKYPRLVDKYNVSGVPNILLFRDGVEDKRIMGLVSYSNIVMISKRRIRSYINNDR